MAQIKLLGRWTEESKETVPKPHPSQTLERLLSQFHIIVRQLKRRHDNRATLVIEDEYDVQDLLHALLLTIFDDVRPEEYTPSYAGAASRIDFVLKQEKIVIEVKMTRDKLRDKQVGDQLLIDIGRYQEHPDCETLICFVYDPGSFIRNPVGLENDLTREQKNLSVRVFVVPH
ncbi:MAG: hypothetical protein K8S97_04160 [Anaerolineae bacterium]|nr:hypothetical protein [Anaerolineae bacterium]